MKLDVKEEKFCLAYAKSGNATQSYLEAFGTENAKSAGVKGCHLLKKVSIQNRLAELAEEIRKPAIADAAEIQEILTRLIRSEDTEEQVVVEGSGNGYSKARIVQRAVQKKDIVKAAELLAKMQGAFDNTLKVEMTIPVFEGDDELAD